MSTGSEKNKLMGVQFENCGHSQASTDQKGLQSKESAEVLQQASHGEGLAGSIETIPIQNSQQQNINTVEKLPEPNNGQQNNQVGNDFNQIQTGSQNIAENSTTGGVRMSIPIGQRNQQNGETNKESQQNSTAWLKSKTQSKNTNDFLIIDIVGKSPSNTSEVIRIPTSEGSAGRQPAQNNVLNVLHFQEYTEDKTGKELQILGQYEQTGEQLNNLTKHSSPKSGLSKTFIDSRNVERQIVGITEKQGIKTFQRNLTKMSQDRKKSAHISSGRNSKSSKSLKSLKKTMLIKKFPEQDIQELQNNMKNQKEKNFQKLQQSVINNRFKVSSNLNPSNANDDLIHISSASNLPQKSSQHTHISKVSQVQNQNHNRSSDKPNQQNAPSLAENSMQNHLPEEASYQQFIIKSQYQESDNPTVNSKNKIQLNLTAMNAPVPSQKKTPFMGSRRSNQDHQINRRSSNVAQTKHPIILSQNISERRSAMMVCSAQQQNNDTMQHLNVGNEFELTNEEETQRIKSSNRFVDETQNPSLTQQMILNLEAGPQQSSLANNNTEWQKTMPDNDQLNVKIFENEDGESQPIIAKQTSILVEEVDDAQNDNQEEPKIQQKTVKKKLMKGVSCSNVIQKKKHFQRKTNQKWTMNQTKTKLYNHNVRSQENLHQAQIPQLGIQVRRISATRKHQTRTRQKMEIFDLKDKNRVVSDTPKKRSIMVVQQQLTDSKSNIYLKSTLKKQDLSPMKIGRGDILDSHVYASENDELNSSAQGQRINMIKDYKNINQQQYDFEQNLSSGERQRSLQDSSKTRIFQKSKSSVRKSQMSMTRRDILTGNTKNVSLTLLNSPQKGKKSPRKSCLGTPPQLEAVYNKDNMQVQGLSMQSARKLHSPRYLQQLGTSQMPSEVHTQRPATKIVKKPKKSPANKNKVRDDVRELSEASTLKRSSGIGEGVNQIMISQHSNQKIKKINIDTVAANKAHYNIDLQQCDQDVIDVQKDVPLHQKLDSTSKSLINMAQNRSDFNDLTSEQQNQVLAEQHKVLKNLDKLKSDAAGSKEDRQNSSVTIKSIVESLKALKSLQGLQTTRNQDLPEDSVMIEAQPADNCKTQKFLHAQEDQIGSPSNFPVDYTTNNFLESNHSDINQLKPKGDWEQSFQNHSRRANPNELMVEGMGVTGKDTQRSKPRRLSLQQRRQPPEITGLNFDQFEAKNTGVGTDELEQLFGPISFRDGGRNQYNLDVEDLAGKTGLSIENLNQVLNSQEFARLYSTTNRTRKESKTDVDNVYDLNQSDIANTKIGNITIYAAQTKMPSHEQTLAGGGRTGETTQEGSQMGSVFDVSFLHYLNSLTEVQKLELYQNQLNQACLHLSNRQFGYSPRLLTDQFNVKQKDQRLERFRTNSNVRSTSILAGMMLPRIIINNVKGKNKVVFIDPHQGKSQDYNKKMLEKQKGLHIQGQSVDVIKGTGPGSSMGVPTLMQQIQQLTRLHQDMMQCPENDNNSQDQVGAQSVDNVSSKHLNSSNIDIHAQSNVLSPMSEAQNLTFHNKSRKSIKQNIQSVRMNAKSTLGKVRRQHQLLCDTVVKKKRSLYGDQLFNNQVMSNQPYDLQNQNRGPMAFGAASPLDMINLQIMNFDFNSYGDDSDKTRAVLGSQLLEAQRGLMQGVMFPFSTAELQADQMKLLNILQDGQMQQSQEFGPRPAPLNGSGTYFFKPDELMLAGHELSAISNGGTLLNHQLQGIYQQYSTNEVSPLPPQMSTQLVSRMKQTQGDQHSSSVPPELERGASSMINPFDHLNLDTSQMTRQVGNTSQSYNRQLNHFDSKSRSSAILNDNELMERVYNISHAQQSRGSPQPEEKFKIEKRPDSSLSREDPNNTKTKKKSPKSPTKNTSPLKGNDKVIKPQLIQNPPQVNIQNFSFDKNSLEDKVETEKVNSQKKIQNMKLNSITGHMEPDTLLQDSIQQTAPNDANLEQYAQINLDESFAGAVGQKTPLVQIRDNEGKSKLIFKNDGFSATGGPQALMKLPLDASLTQSQNLQSQFYSSQLSMSGQINDMIKMMQPALAMNTSPLQNNEIQQQQQQTNSKELVKNKDVAQNQRYTLKTSNQNKRSKYFGNLDNGRSVSNTRITNSNSKFSKTFYSMKQSKSNCSRYQRNTHISTQVPHNPSFNNLNAAYNKDIMGDNSRNKQIMDPHFSDKYYYVNQDQIKQHLQNFRESHKYLGVQHTSANKSQNKKSGKKVPQVSFSPIKIEELINQSSSQNPAAPSGSVKNTQSTLRQEQLSQIKDDEQGTLRNDQGQIHSITTLKNIQKDKKTVKDILGGQEYEQSNGLQQKIMTQFKVGTNDKMMQLKSRQQQQFIEKWTNKNAAKGMHTQTQPSKSYLQDGTTLNSQSHSPNIFKHNITAAQMMNNEPNSAIQNSGSNLGIQMENQERIPSTQNLLQKRFNLSPSKSSVGFAQQTTIPLRSGALSHSNLSKKSKQRGVQCGFQQLTEDESATITPEQDSSKMGPQQQDVSHKRLSFNNVNGSNVTSNAAIAIQDHSSSRKMNLDISNLDDEKLGPKSPTDQMEAQMTQSDLQREAQFEKELNEEVTITEDNEDTIVNSQFGLDKFDTEVQIDRFQPPKPSILGELRFKHMFLEMSKNNDFAPTPGRFYQPEKTEKPYMKYTCSTKLLKTDMGGGTPLNLLEQYRQALKYGQNQYPKTPMSTRPVFSNFSDEQKFYSQQYKINPIDIKSHSQALKNFEQIKKSEKISDYIRRQKRFPMSPPPMGKKPDTFDDSKMSGEDHVTQQTTQFFDKRGTTFSPNNAFNDQLTLSRESLQQIAQLQNTHIERHGFTNLLKRNSSMKFANRTTRNVHQSRQSVQQLKQSVGLKKGRVNLDRDSVMRSNGIQRCGY